MTTPRRRGVLVLVLAGMLVGPLSGTALGVTKRQVDDACRSSQAAYNEYLAAQASFNEAANAYEAAVQAVEAILRKQEHTADIVTVHRGEIELAQARFQRQAVERYMQVGRTNPSLLLLAPTVGDLLTTTELLKVASGEEESTVADLDALQGQLAAFQADLRVVETERRQVETQLEEVALQQEQAMLAEQAAWEKLNANCQRLRNQYEVEQARARARAGGGAAGAPAALTPGFICPFPATSGFIDSWGYPRSGGRRHKGTDMFGPWDGNLVAVASGTVLNGTSSLGGKQVWLAADYGTAYYYAHLSDFAVTSGSRVNKGDLVGYNGNTGNARGGQPHLHFEIHPAGRGSAAVNPYPTLRAACR
jgi:murein DD-endopeptidase MepM/ murein hydrolase activator NlpD